MARSVSELVSAANESVPKISPDEAQRLINKEDALLVDLRDPPELTPGGKLRDAVNVSRGMLEFRADRTTPYYDPAFLPDRPVILYCGSGGRAALAGKALQEMGYKTVYNLGGFKDAVEKGFPTEPA